uniref:peptidylprolyl isomerase n=1 Tax=Noctiluca scintillans TaxID=2966 RepID=A0A7S0ZV05_NOCSC|mmetsp:Transcript_2008/g.5722  ORF Transcript_2008/g.5722 Transcript_2008/m.5722 type:complete len:239 (+) Transcript_2008:47-763(+)|eukprot:CAMPEP_0194503388 /NCGR_PEP_ID=MMETSP0253-20130528/28354_1 /TAXON_ID=2966 /ORGANISM="Noctiluca scintillans" /LENGTH=238 /DNA_ID=CAMNT_0039345667 /DNA_START=47 /DNA_END=763 /DNA_ORIENTATION=-
MGFREVLILTFAVCHPSWATNEQGLEFLEATKSVEGVVTLRSGLQYKVLKSGDGKFHPTKDSPCECHYAGTTPALTPDAIDLDEVAWNEFDSSYKRGEPTTFAPNQVIKAWTQAMQLMVEGDKWEMYIPSELGYGDTGTGDKIKGGDVLIFRMELLHIKGNKKRAVPCDLKTRKNCYDSEVEMLDLWGKASLETLTAEKATLKKQLGEPLKSGQREPLQEKMRMLNQIAKARSKGTEL